MMVVKPFVHVFCLLLICTTENVCGKRLVAEEKIPPLVPNLFKAIQQVLSLLDTVTTILDNVEDTGNVGEMAITGFLNKILQRLQGILQQPNVRVIGTPIGEFMGDTRERPDFELNNGGAGGGVGGDVGSTPGGGI